MRALVTLMTALSLPIGILNLFGGITAGIWLAILGEWKVIGVGLLLLVSSHFLLAFILMPGLIFAAPAVKAFESGRTTIGALVVSLAVVYTTVVVIVWSYLMLRYFYARVSESSEIPLLLWSYGAATGPWAFMASKDQQGQDGGNPNSMFAVFFLSLGYICCMLALIFGDVSVGSCLWILATFMSVSCVISVSVAFVEMRERLRPGV
jgi:hypothetical protein